MGWGGGRLVKAGVGKCFKKNKRGTFLRDPRVQEIYLNSSAFVAEVNELMAVLFLGSRLARCSKRD